MSVLSGGILLAALDMHSLPITAFERTGSYDSNRRWVDGEDSREWCFSGSIQPASAKELRLMPEGDRSGGTYILFTTEKLDVADTSELAGQNPSNTFIKEEDDIWRVMYLMDWNRNTGHRRYVLKRFIDSKR